MNNIFALFDVDLPPELKSNIIKAHHAKISDKAIAKYLRLPLAEVKRVIAQEEHAQVELAQWQAVIGHKIR